MVFVKNWFVKWSKHLVHAQIARETQKNHILHDFALFSTSCTTLVLFARKSPNCVAISNALVTITIHANDVDGYTHICNRYLGSLKETSSSRSCSLVYFFWYGYCVLWFNYINLHSNNPKIQFPKMTLPYYGQMNQLNLIWHE